MWAVKIVPREGEKIRLLEEESDQFADSWGNNSLGRSGWAWILGVDKENVEYAQWTVYDVRLYSKDNAYSIQTARIVL